MRRGRLKFATLIPLPMPTFMRNVLGTHKEVELLLRAFRVNAPERDLLRSFLHGPPFMRFLAHFCSLWLPRERCLRCLQTGVSRRVWPSPALQSPLKYSPFICFCILYHLLGYLTPLVIL